MAKIYACDRIVRKDGLQKGYITVENGIIVRVSDTKDSRERAVDFSGAFVIPGLVELHSHGGGGHAFLTDSPEEVAAACEFHYAHGVTAMLPTVSADEFASMRQAAFAVADARDRRLTRCRIPGAHLEGPYLSRKQCGAQCPSYLSAPVPADYEPLCRDVRRPVARWTYAPETDPDNEFLRCLVKNGIIASAGHTDAVYAELDRAIPAGLSLITHLYSCTSTVTRRNGFRYPGAVETAFLRDELRVEIIGDGRHLPPEMVRMIVKIKGVDRVCLISDSLSIAGTDQKQGSMGGTDFVVEDGVCKLLDRSAFAGSIAAGNRILQVMTRECGISLPDAVRMMSSVPAAVLGLNAGEIAPGKRGDFAVLDDDLEVLQTITAE